MDQLTQQFQGVFDAGAPEYDLIARLNPARIPRHVAVIMDGNGRWARQRMRPRVAGHRAGIEAVKASVETAVRLRIRCLTLYAFSAENWQRPEKEVKTLMELLEEYLQRELNTLQKYDVRFRPVGHIEDLPEAVAGKLRFVESETEGNRGMNLTVALSYSGRQEIVDACSRLLEEGVRAPLEEKDIQSRLYTANLPDPDLLVRTSGEMRVSNFLLWQIAYSEIYVTEVLWPDFRETDFLKAILAYQKRDRRFGAVPTPSLQETG